jgi:hypothetical protein
MIVFSALGKVLDDAASWVQIVRWFDAAVARRDADPIAAVLADIVEDIQPPPREEVAYHEAGHVVISILLGLPPLERVSIRPGEGFNGRTRYATEGRVMSPTSDVVKRTVQALVAGDLGRRAGVVAYSGKGVRKDALLASFLVELAGPPDQTAGAAEAEIRRAQAAVEAVLTKPDVRRALDAIAHALLDRETLTGCEVMEIVQTAGLDLTPGD